MPAGPGVAFISKRDVDDLQHNLTQDSVENLNKRHPQLTYKNFSRTIDHQKQNDIIKRNINFCAKKSLSPLHSREEVNKTMIHKRNSTLSRNINYGLGSKR